MQLQAPLAWNDQQILALRSAKHVVDARSPYLYFVENECSSEGILEAVATIFLTNRECTFRCLMCDLWKNTLDESVPLGALPTQIDQALADMPPATVVKLYNSGNFFDHRAVPPQDYEAIAERVRSFRRVIVENHPRLCGDDCQRFHHLITPARLDVALGLETIHPRVLPALNKRMTVDDFARAAEFLIGIGAEVRAFLLLKPPYLSEAEGVEWVVKSMDFAFSCGVECCSIVPTRGGNGALERLSQQGLFQPPALKSMEAALEAGLARRRGRVFMDLWDAERFAHCSRCTAARIGRLRHMNLTQQIAPAIDCDCSGES